MIVRRKKLGKKLDRWGKPFVALGLSLGLTMLMALTLLPSLAEACESCLDREKASQMRASTSACCQDAPIASDAASMVFSPAHPDAAEASGTGACCHFNGYTWVCRQDTPQGCQRCYGAGTACYFYRGKSCSQACPNRLDAADNNSGCGCGNPKAVNLMGGTPSSVVSDVEFGPADDVAPDGRILVYVEVKCPRCGCWLGSYKRYVESNRAYVGSIVSISFTGSCFNREKCGSGKFDWRGTVTSGRVYRVVSQTKDEADLSDCGCN